jgi:hypothetical protein
MKMRSMILTRIVLKDSMCNNNMNSIHICSSTPLFDITNISNSTIETMYATSSTNLINNNNTTEK